TYRSHEHHLNVLNGEIGQEFKDALLKAKNLKVFAFFPRGPRYMTSNKPIRSVEDVKGLKLRVPPVPVYIEAWKSLGANVTPIDYSELYMALKQGVVEGQENPLATIDALKLSSVQKYLIETKHHLLAFTMSMDNDRFQKLTPTQQKAIEEAANEAADLEYQLMLENEDALKAKLQEEGMELIQIADIAAFRDPVVKRLPEVFKDKWAPNLWDRIQAVE
ncbi:MAG: TRAP transporter substrate-binding protein, partial [Lentisphaerae bacterium]|nr:TRAP transporter substrate-binding protein [Lentisphaerota bacterium]